MPVIAERVSILRKVSQNGYDSFRGMIRRTGHDTDKISVELQVNVEYSYSSNVNLSASVYRELQTLSKKCRCPI